MVPLVSLVIEQEVRRSFDVFPASNISLDAGASGPACQTYQMDDIFLVLSIKLQGRSWLEMHFVK